MVRRLQTARMSSVPQHHNEEDYDDYHDGDTDEEIGMESPPTSPAPAPAQEIVEVSDGEDQEEAAEGHGQEDDPDNHPEEGEPAEEVTWMMYSYTQDGRGVPMADELRTTAYRLGYATPAYQCELWTHPWFEPHWEVTAIMREEDPLFGHKEVSRHRDVANRTTIEAGIAEAARRALYVLSHRERARLEDTRSVYTPYRASGEAKTYIAPAPAYEGVLNNLRGLLAAVNTALDDTNNTLAEAQQKVFTLESQKRYLEAALLNKELPVIHNDEEPHNSPSPKRPRYNSPDARTEDLP